MRIFCAIRHSNDQALFHGALWSANFYPALSALGHEIVESQTDLLAASRFMAVPGEFTPEELAVRERITDGILAEVREAHRRAPVHLFLSYFYNSHFDPAGFDELRRLGIPSVNFYCNSMHQFDLVAAVASKTDFAWHTEREARPKYIAAGANAVWVQMGANPNLYRPLPSIERHPKLCFVGQCYADRSRWLGALLEAGLPVEIYGAGWIPGVRSSSFADAHRMHLGRSLPTPGSARSYALAARQTLTREGVIGGFVNIARQMALRRANQIQARLLSRHASPPIPFERMLEVFASSAVCLNFSNVWAEGHVGSRLVPHVRLRDFEAPMARTCYLTGRTDEIAESYRVGSEIDTYSSPEELIDKARFYLANPEVAERLRQAGHLRAVRDHTWVRRFQELFRKVSLTGPSAVSV